MGTWLKRSTSRKKYVFNHEHESMEQQLEGLFTSDQPDIRKEALITGICEQGTQGQNTDNAVKGVLMVSSKWILNGTTTLQVSSGFKLFEAWGKHNMNSFLSFFTPGFVAEMLIHGYGGMAANVPLLLREGFRVMNRLDLEHVQVVQDYISKFVSKAQDRIVVRNVKLLLEEFPDCLPCNESDNAGFCLAVVQHLSVGVPPENSEEIQKYMNNTEEIASFLSKLWFSQQMSTVNTSLTAIFDIISAPRTDETSEPAICLAALVKHIPIEMVYKAVNGVVTDQSIRDESIEVAMGQIMEWLKWPTAQNVDLWLLCFLSELAKAHKFSLLIRIVEATTEQVTENLAYPRLRQASFKVLSHMLLGFQHSPGPFHKCLEKMPIIIHFLRDEGTAQSGAFLKELSELIYDLMHQHTGFPELYEPVLELIKDFPQPSIEEIKIKLNQIRWLSQGNCMSVTETATPSLLMTAVKQEKLEMGKAGLDNLGNTCYMSSVLQALYMCDQFRRGILAKMPTEKEGLHSKLQYVFAHLSQTSRPSFAPSKFLHASRPPWFLPGHQQDCSEFLKYLLDQLHEEEKSAHSGMKKSQSSGSITPSSPITINTGTLSKSERKKATVMLTSVKMKTDAEMYGFNFSRSVSTETDKGSNTEMSLVEKTFRGKMQTTLRCLVCKQKSSRIESFADIPLAFPNYSKPVDYTQKNLAGGNSEVGRDDEGTNSEFTTEAELAKSNEMGFSVNELVSFYLKPEKLTGDNKYHCDHCGKLQDGERSIQIIESPQYLILTLLRFTYDTKLQTRTKIFQDVHYPRTLAIPVCDHPSNDVQVNFVKQHSRNNSTSSPRTSATIEDSYLVHLENIAKCLAPKCDYSAQGTKASSHLYGLTGVIVHSGASSECGHYYCYARHSQAGLVDATLLDKMDGSLDNLDLLPDDWYNFNDSRVCHASFESFSNVTKKFSKDTAYVLIYRKLSLGGQGWGMNSEPVLRSELRDAVIKDNEAYLKEQEVENKAREEQQRRRSSSVNSANLNHWKSKEDYNDYNSERKNSSGYLDSLASGLDITGYKYMF